MRFINDPLYGEIMERMRLGLTTQQYLDILNTRLITSSTITDDKMISYITLSHKIRELM